MINPRNLEIKNYDYNLPEERIAKYPLEQRDQSKLLVWKGEIEEHHFCDLPSQIPAGSMIVFNNTKVIQARLHFRKPTGGIVEVFCLEPESPAKRNVPGPASWATARSGRTVPFR